jgi:chlorite dismutase
MSTEQDLEQVSVAEYGADRDGERQSLNSRLFMQLLALECAWTPGPQVLARELAEQLERRSAPGVIYQDVLNPAGLAVLSWSDDPARLLSGVHQAVMSVGPSGLALRPHLQLLGRTYSSGFEHDLADWLIERPKRTALNPEWPWAVWYPLRRGGAFERLSPREKGAIMKEHANIGRAYAAQDLAHDIRLACHGLDAHDNEFVVGLMGRDLHPLSHIVQRMRSTKQTSEYVTQMGPFFVGHALWRNG